MLLFLPHSSTFFYRQLIDYNTLLLPTTYQLQLLSQSCNYLLQSFLVSNHPWRTKDPQLLQDSPFLVEHMTDPMVTVTAVM